METIEILQVELRPMQRTLIVEIPKTIDDGVFVDSLERMTPVLTAVQNGGAWRSNLVALGG